MQQLLVQGLVVALIFTVIYMGAKHLVKANSKRSEFFGLKGRQVLGGAVIAGLASVGATLVLTVRPRAPTTIFVQDPPF